jgi:IS30 family transposase
MKKPKKYVCLSDSERSEIEILKHRGYSNRKIARALGRSPNTIGYEINANSVINSETGAVEYVAKKAKAKSRLSKRSRRYQWRKIEHNPKLWGLSIILCKLQIFNVRFWGSVLLGHVYSPFKMYGKLV